MRNLNELAAHHPQQGPVSTLIVNDKGSRLNSTRFMSALSY